jgi:hypothetical protein
MSKPAKPNPSSVLTLLSERETVSPVTLDRVWTAVLLKMMLLYYPPHRADSEDELLELSVIALEDYLDDLAEFDRMTLQAAWREVRRAHRGQGWPTIAAIRDACLAHTPRRREQEQEGLPEWYRQLASRIGATPARSWFGEAVLRVSGRQATFMFPSKASADWCKGRYAHEALTAVQSDHPEVTELLFMVKAAVAA